MVARLYFCGLINPKSTTTSICIAKTTMMGNLTFMKLAISTFSIVVVFLVFLTIRRLCLSELQNMNFVRHGEDTFLSREEMFLLLNGSNTAEMSFAIDPKRGDALRQDDFGLFHIVTNFVPFNSKELSKNLRIDGKPPTGQQLEERMSEILKCLQENMNNNKIAKVHLLVFGEEAITYLQSLRLNSSHKLIIHENDKWPTILDQIMYASKYLQGKMVIMCHQDNYIGEGWDNFNHEVFRRERLMYALTRHQSPSHCNGAMEQANCREGFRYIGSHDIFVFYVNGPIDRRKLVEIDVTPNVNGMENVLIWEFRTRLKYRILNPCKVFVVYHEHCIAIRETGRKRINVKEKSAETPFTDELQ